VLTGSAPRRRLALCLLIASGMAPAVVRAQTPGPVEIRQFQPSPFSDRTLRLDGSGVLPAGKLHVGIDADYAYRPLFVTDVGAAAAGTPASSYDVVRHAVGADLTVALGLGARLEVGARLPLTVFQTGEAVPGAGSSPSSAGLENPRLGLKARLLGDGRDGLSVAASLVVALPVGTGGHLIHEEGLGGDARLTADYRTDRLSLGLGGGYRLRRATSAYDIALDDELTYGAGARLRVSQRGELLVEAAGSTAAGQPFRSIKQSPLELLFGGRRRVGDDGGFAGGNLWLTAAAGPGLVAGYGSPLLRVVVGLAWSNRPLVPCREALCPVRVEPPPPPPPPPPKPPAPPPAPPADRDHDGIVDDEDVCPDEPEDKDGFEDQDGCPDPDNDKDGILDAQDKCPNEPETINGKDDDDGCPDEGAPEVHIGKDELETLRPVFFETDHARVRHAFYSILGQVALTLKAHPEIGRCAVEGHTDDTGPADWNRRLSVRRAEAVVEFLVARGVDRSRLVPIGQAEKLPWAPNDTEEGRAKNRRVIFHIEGVDAGEQQQEQLKEERRRQVRARKEATEPPAQGPATEPTAPTAPTPTEPLAPTEPPAPVEPPTPTAP